MPKTEILSHVAQDSFCLSTQIRLSHHADAYKIEHFAGESVWRFHNSYLMILLQRVCIPAEAT